ncbi:MAG: DedA family protein [Planctomycetota bacterium]|nr:DedA family protein [Planctomycetota bacterium]
MGIESFSSERVSRADSTPPMATRLAKRVSLLLLILSTMLGCLAQMGVADPRAQGHSSHSQQAANDVAKPSSGVEKQLSQMFDRFGPLSVFLLMVVSGAGLHFPEDMVIIPAGWEIARGHFSLGHTFLAAYLGVVLGDSGWFLLCRFFGTRLLRSNWLLRAVHPRRILEMKYLIDHYGAWVLVICRLIPGTRTPALTVGGLMHLKGWIFLAVELPMVFLTVGSQLAVGYYAARGSEIGGIWHKIIFIAGLVIAIMLLIGIFTLRRKMASGDICLPRASMQWLRKIRSTARANQSV